LIEHACELLGVTDVNGIHVSRRGKKFVRRVRRDGRDVVMKVTGLASRYPWRLADAQREVELLAAIQNPYIVKLESELAVIGSPPYGVAWLEELVDGRDLTRCFRRPWEWAAAARMGREVALGLASAHAVNVVHCDLSPDNVRVLQPVQRKVANFAMSPSVDRQVADFSDLNLTGVRVRSTAHYKVMDFGLARHILRDSTPVISHWGTWGFMSPEHIKLYSGAPTPVSDVFCIGSLMYMTLTGGQPPIPYTGDDKDYSARLHNAEVVDIGVKRSDLDADQQAVIRRCLHPQPARRYLDAQRLADALAEFG
jgi:serine/threonine-protein kinase